VASSEALSSPVGRRAERLGPMFLEGPHRTNRNNFGSILLAFWKLPDPVRYPSDARLITVFNKVYPKFQIPNTPAATTPAARTPCSPSARHLRTLIAGKCDTSPRCSGCPASRQRLDPCLALCSSNLHLPRDLWASHLPAPRLELI
jgi:hypothetical protein